MQQMTYLEGLNERQRQAVLATQGPVSVLAGAGSGKTKVLTTRIYHLIREGTPAENILAVTFTNKAAKEMKERIAIMLGENPESFAGRMRQGGVPFITTFHGLGRELLERHGSVLAIPRHFTIFDRDDSKAAIRDALKKLDIDPKEVPPGNIISRISKAKGEGMDVHDFAKRHGSESFFSRTVASVWPLYNEYLQKEKALDFDDLILLSVRLLEEHPDVRSVVQKRWEYIHIDEYQDTSVLQNRLAELLAESHKNIFVCGDIDQCIYTWRQARIENLLDFERVYTNAVTIVLEHNYRSTKTIVAAGNAVIEKNTNRKEKRSVTDNPDGDLISFHVAPNGDAEARFIARTAKQLIASGTEPKEIAVLFRTNFQSRALEEGFLSEGVAYKLLGTRFYERKEVKDTLAWMRLALEPGREVDRMRAVQFPTRGIGKVLLGKMLSGDASALKPAERTKVSAFDAIVESLTRAAETMTPSEFVRTVLEKSGIATALQSSGEEERLENVRELVTLATRYDEAPGKEGIATFLADAALASDQDELDRTRETSGVNLMTVHAAKGLEFDVVFVTGLEEGLFPHEGQPGESRDQEEERRLFYVALTRAKKKLYLTMARVRRIYGSDFLSEPSSFITDIDQSALLYTEAETEPSIYL